MGGILMPSIRRVKEIGDRTGFREDIIEKVIRLENLMLDIFAHPYLSKRFLLKGGTSLNFCYFNTSRLSVDIDLNYIGKTEIEEMKKEKLEISKSIKKILEDQRYKLLREPQEEHAGGKWLLGYKDLWDNNRNLEIDINYLFRVSIGVPQEINFKAFQDSKEFNITLVSKEELFAGKTVATLFRTSAKDVYDLANIAGYSGEFDRVLFRKAVILLGSSQRKDFRKIKPDKLQEITEKDIEVFLYPLIPQSERVSRNKLLRVVEPFVANLLNFKKEEQEFLDRFLNKAEYIPILLFKEYPNLSKQLEKHPALLWKRLNVEKHFKAS